MSSPHHIYLAVLKASYDYQPQSDDEIALTENQLLFLVERVDADWWKVKVKGESIDDNGPTGLVPAAYVESADHTGTVKALYDYEAAADGEVTIKEDEALLTFAQEEEWMLVQTDREGGLAGWVPANYVEASSETEEAPAAAPQIVIPPSPPRPVSTYIDPAERVASAKVTADDIKTWSVSEVDQKGKKKKGTLGVGNGAVFFASESDKNPVQKWQTVDIEHISIEKSKHVHIAVGGAYATTLHFSTGSRDLADAIVEKLHSSKEISTAAASSAPETHEEAPTRRLPPVKEAKAVHFSPAPAIIPNEDDEPPEPQQTAHHDESGEGEAAVALYDFNADGDDELSVAEGEHITVLERDNDDWWKCRNAEGREGVIPASYVDLSGADPSTSIHTNKEDEESDHDDAEEREEEERRKEEERRRQQEARAEEEKRIQKENLEKQRKKEAEKRAKAAAEAAEAQRAERKRRKDEAAARAESQTPPIPSARQQQPESKRQSTASQQSASRTSLDNGRPPPEKTRVWRDRTGQFRVEAAFLGVSNGKLRLHKVNGVIVEVPSERMSLEDLLYVEKITKKTRPQPNPQRVSEDDVPLAIAHPQATQPTPKKGRQVDWFEFFLGAGCDTDDCTRYASAFERDKIDEALLPDITEGTMRNLGLREGDIIRVTRHIEKLHPKPKPESEKKQSGPAPNLFAEPGGTLKAPRRGRPQPNKSLPTAVDMNSIPSASIIQTQRSASPRVIVEKSPSPVQPPARGSSNLKSGFDDDAWTNRPSSTQPIASSSPAPNPSIRAPSAPPMATPTATAPAPAPAPVASPPVTVTSPVQTAPTTGNLANTTESDIFNQLARLSQLKTSSPAPPPAPASAPITPVASPPAVSIPTGYQGLNGMSAPQQRLNGGFSPSPVLQQQQQQQPYNGPRGPLAPVPTNQSLLQPLIPTQTGFAGFVPTRPSGGSSPFQPLPPSNFSSPPVMSNPTGMPFGNFNQPNGGSMNSYGSLAPNPTGFAGSFNSGFSPLQPNQGNFNGTQGFSQLQPQPTGFNPNFGGMVQSQPTGFNPSYNQSPFGNGTPSPPPVPPLPSMTGVANTNPANIFAQMKSGTFAAEDNNGPQSADKYNSLRPNPVLSHPTGWLNYPGGH